MNLTYFVSRILRSDPLIHSLALHHPYLLSMKTLLVLKCPFCFEARLTLFNTVEIYFCDEISFLMQNDSSAQVPASGSLPTFLPMMTSTPNMVFTNLYSCYQTIKSFITKHSSYYIDLKDIPTSLTGRFSTHWLK